MGDFISGVLGTNSAVNTQSKDPYSAINGWQDRASTLADQLQTQSTGGGPNPAQLQYLQNAQQIAQQQANTYSANRALNPGLAARLAGNSSASVQQNAAAQAGVQQAQQQLASQQMLGNVSAQQQGALNQAGGINAGVAAGNQQQAGNIVGGIMGGAGAALGLAHGGEVHNPKTDQVPMQSRFQGQGGFPGQSNYDDGGLVMPSFGSTLSAPINQPGLGVSGVDPIPVQQGNYNLGELGGSGSGAKSKAGQFLSGMSGKMGSSGSNDIQGAFNQFSRYMSKGGKVDAMVSPGEKYLNPSEAEKVAKGKASVKSEGKKIPGKAEVSGDSIKNDKVPASLDDGGIVIPRSKMGSEEEAQKFVAKEMAKHMKSPEGEFHQALKRAVEKRKNK